jgi:hypothetical protein
VKKIRASGSGKAHRSLAFGPIERAALACDTLQPRVRTKGHPPAFGPPAKRISLITGVLGSENQVVRALAALKPVALL